MRWVLVDLIVLLAVFAALWVGYARDLPPDALTYGIIPADHVTCELFFSTDRSGLDALALAVKTGPTPAGDRFFFEPGSDLISLWPVGAALLVVELLSLLGIFSDVRRIRRRLQPLNALALSAEALGSKDIMDASKIESLEQAIERASVDSPQVKTGVDDLASIEVALNGLLRQMQEAKLQQIRFVSDASHELRTPIAVIQGYVNMLDRWGKDDRAVLEESIAALKAEGAHMQELVEQLLFLARGDSGRNTLDLASVNLAALVVGSTLMGAIGMVVAIPLCAALKGLFVFYFEKSTGRALVAYDGAIFQGTPFRDDDGEPVPAFDALGDDSFVQESELIDDDVAPTGSAVPRPDLENPWSKLQFLHRSDGSDHEQK